MKKFSVVIPTYSGEEFLPSTLDSLLGQKGKHKYEVIIVIDGPIESLKKIALEYKKIFEKRKIKFTIIQFNKNKGRFHARYEGAVKAKTPTILFADDRNIMDPNYLNAVLTSGAKVVMANVIQRDDKTLISKTLYLLRRFIYKNQFENFKSYYIDESNFEKSPKGTAGLLVPRNLFIEICQEFSKNNKDLKNSSDDTKLFRGILIRGEKIYRCCPAKIYYQSRTKFSDEVKHLYERGPKFVDYYLRPGTRFFLPLIMAMAIFIAILLTLLIQPNLVLYAVLGIIILDLIISVLISSSLKDVPKVFIALPLIMTIFFAGVMKGLIRRFLKS